MRGDGAVESGNGQMDAPLGRSNFMKNAENGRISDSINIVKERKPIPNAN